MSNANLYAVLQGGFPKDRRKVALETPDLEYTWDDIDRATACLANLLASLDLPDGSIYLVRGLGFFALVMVGAHWELYAAATIGGIVWAGSIALSSAILADVYGIRLVGVLYGLTYLGHQVGGMIDLTRVIRNLKSQYGVGLAGNDADESFRRARTVSVFVLLLEIVVNRSTAILCSR